jgi:hypothetical protein
MLYGSPVFGSAWTSSGAPKNANDRVEIHTVFFFSMSSHFLALSPELHLSIISYLPLFDKRRLRLVCQLFNNLLDVPFRDLRTAKQKQTILLVKDAEEEELGFEPFIIMDVRNGHTDSDEFGTECTPSSKNNISFSTFTTQNSCETMMKITTTRTTRTG